MAYNAEYQRQYRSRNKERIAQVQRDWYLRNKERAHAQARQWHRKNGRALRLKKYGMTPSAYEALLAEQDGGCAICGERDRLAVDHDHESGSVRGILCGACNTALGSFGDSVEGLEAAISYLKRGGSLRGLTGED